MKERILKLGKSFILYSSILWIGVLFIISVFSTSYFDPEDMGSEHILYRWDNPIVIILFSSIIFLLLYILNKKNILIKISSKKLLCCLLIYTFVLGLLWVLYSGVFPEADQMYVSAIAHATSEDKYNIYKPGKYIQIYPNQIGLVAVLELIYRIVGEEKYQIFQFINVITNLFIYVSLFKIVEVTFKNKKITNLFLFLCFGCVPLILYSTFVYGVTLGLAFALWAVYLELYFIKNHNWLYGILSAISISVAILLKNNYIIFLVGMILILIYKGIEQKRLRFILLIVVFLLTWKGTEEALISNYEQRSGYELSDGMPKIMWVAMGMQEGERAEGWYNGFNYDTFYESGCNPETSSFIAKKEIKNSISKFVENPEYAIKFYVKKFVSQWNEPTYASFWVNIFHQGEYSKIMQSLFDGKLNTLFFEYMNLYQSLILFGVVLVLIKNRKKWGEEQLLLLLVVLGGFLFHMLWEAKSQYIMPYFILFLPYAAAGLSAIMEK